MIDGVEIAWAAGLFEGEGSLSVMAKKGGRPAIQLSITSTDHDVLERFTVVVNAGKVYGPYRAKDKCKPQYQWRAHGWDLLQRLHDDWARFLGKRRRERFKAVLALRPARYVRTNLATRRLAINEVQDIRRRLLLGEAQRGIGATHRVSQTTISDIKLGNTYQEIR